MEPRRVAETLQDAEIAILDALKEKKSADPEKLAEITGLKTDAISRAGLWLQNKGLVDVKEAKDIFVALDNLGNDYVEKKLPERRFLEALKEQSRFLDEVAEIAKLDKNEIKVSLGYWKQKNCVKFEDNKLVLTDTGRSYFEKKTLEEEFLEKIKDKELEVAMLVSEDKAALDILKKRGLIREIEKKHREYSVTDFGLKVADESKIIEKRIGILTPDLIRTGNWKDMKFRRYDVLAPVPKLYPGKKQAYLAFLDEVKETLTSMGFKEMTGPLVELSFFNNDALFMPQDHPARGIHDVYFVSKPEFGNIGKYKKFLSEIKTVHESGGKSGSVGWQIPFDEKESSRLVLRSQGTALSARTLADVPKIPGAYFSIARCYRPEKSDVSHLPEFNQCEGIVLGENVNFRHLFGLLAEFVKKLAGTDKIKFVPGYFPFTEPSVECLVWDGKKWVELLGAGIFRPEVTKPLGVNVPVLAWGIGIDRLFMIRENISDIRNLFTDDLSKLREAKI